MFFYDNFTPEQVCGIFTPLHFMVIVAFILSFTLVMVLSRKLTPEKSKRLILILAIVVLALEIIKITLRIIKNDILDSWIPLYFCSLFLFAVWFIFSKNKSVQKFGYAYLAFGGIFASVAFIIYPSTSLMIQPLWHLGSIHSIIYHFIMLYIGALVLSKKLYTPKPSDFWYYFAFVTCACLLALAINLNFGTNMMFLDNPFGLGFLQAIKDTSQALYIILAWLAQAVGLYWINFGVYKIITKIKLRRKNNDWEFFYK